MGWQLWGAGSSYSEEVAAQVMWARLPDRLTRMLEVFSPCKQPQLKLGTGGYSSRTRDSEACHLLHAQVCSWMTCSG